MKILVIGHSVVDTIISGGEIKSESPGGIHFTIAGLNSVISARDTISLLSAYPPGDKLFGFQKSVVDKDYSPTVNEIPRVFLNLDAGAERVECYNLKPESLRFDKIESFDQFDGILLNMVTGFETDLSSLIALRNKYTGPIYFDIHTLARGFDEDGKREFRLIPDISKWLSAADIVQVNESELKCVSTESEDSAAAEEILGAGPKALILTRGAKGVSLFRKVDAEILCKSIKAEKVETFSSVGCGDIFGAVFFYNYLSTQNLEISLIAANRAAGLAAGLNDKTKLNLNDDFIR